MRSARWLSVAVLVITLAASARTDALPSFSRKHTMKCSSCHAIYPKLTPLGRSFKENGYRLQKDDSSWKGMLRSFPGSVGLGFQSHFMNDELGPLPSDTFCSSKGTLKPVAGGGGSSWFSFWFDWPMEASTEEPVNVRRQHYWVRLNDVLRVLRPDLLHIKGGQFELALPFTQSRTYNLFTYAPYRLSGSHQESLAAPHRGIELSGSLGRGFRYSVAVADILESPSTEEDTYIETTKDAFDPDLYLRISKTIRNVDRLGFFLYHADNVDTWRIVSTIQPSSSPFPFDFRVTSRDQVELLGADGDGYLSNERFNLYGLFLLGRKDVARNGRSHWDEEFFGGFAQLDTRLFESLTLVARYSFTHNRLEPRPDDLLVRSSRGLRQQDLTLGFQWLVLERLRLGFEYRVLTENLYSRRGAFAVDFIL